MGITSVEARAIERKLITMQTAVDKLASLRSVDLHTVAESPGIHVAVERNLSLLDDLARGVSGLVSALGSRPPHSGEDLFLAATRAGVIDAAVAASLTPPAGAFHVQVQVCMDSEPETVAQIVATAEAAYAEFVRQVADWTGANSEASGSRSRHPVAPDPKGESCEHCPT